MGANVARPLGHGNYSGAAVAVDCLHSGHIGPIQISHGLRDTQVPRAPVQGALYYSLHMVGKLPAELHPALKTHLHQHHGDLALVAPHGLATDPPPPQILARKTEPGLWFHDLPALATLRGAIVAVDAGRTPAGMAMAGVA